MPQIDELIGKSTSFLDLNTEAIYWQIPLVKGAMLRLQFVTICGLFQFFTVLPFGLQGAPATFQMLINCIIQGMQDYAPA